MRFFEEKLLDAVRQRAPGESVVDAFRRPVLDGLKRLGGDEAAQVIATAGTLISASPALEVHEREIVARYTRLLAAQLAEEAGARAGDVEATGVASALMGVQRALVGYVRSSILAGRRGPKLVADARSQAMRGFGRLERGLADYGRKPAGELRRLTTTTRTARIPVLPPPRPGAPEGSAGYRRHDCEKAKAPAKQAVTFSGCQGPRRDVGVDLVDECLQLVAGRRLVGLGEHARDRVFQLHDERMRLPAVQHPQSVEVVDGGDHVRYRLGRCKDLQGKRGRASAADRDSRIRTGERQRIGSGRRVGGRDEHGGSEAACASAGGDQGSRRA